MSRAVAVLKDWIQQCSDSSYLTPWEEEFIESVERQLNSRGFLSVAQEETLERIYAQRTK